MPKIKWGLENTKFEACKKKRDKLVSINPIRKKSQWEK
jgi:hypothetical protein